MPKVGKGKDSKHFPYTPAGQKQAKEYAKKTRQPVSNYKKPKM